MHYTPFGHRKVRRNHSNALPKHLIVYDTETNRTQTDISGRRHTHTFRLAAAIQCRLSIGKPVAITRHRFTDVNTFWRFVESTTGSGHTTWIVSHNALFDMIVSGLPERFERSELTIDMPRSKRQREDNDEDNPHCAGFCVLESPPTIIGARVTSTQGRLIVVDTMNWFPVSLRSLGESVGKPKLPKPDDAADNETWFRYCERDTEIVFDVFTKLIKWVRDNEMGMFRYTAPSQAMSAFRHRFMKEDIYVHDLADVKAIERAAYFGGRTEIFRLGKISETVHQLDINSLFPSVMKSTASPRKLIRYEIRQEYMQLLPDIDYLASVAECKIRTPIPIYPVKQNDLVVFPTGVITTTLCGQELQHAKQHGHILEVKSWAEYETINLFTLWVETMWSMRQRYKSEKNAVYDQFTKTLLNALYGKFAQRTPAWENKKGTIAALPWTSWLEVDASLGKRIPHRSVGWTIQHATDRGEINGTFPAISAFVTSAARMRMNMLRDIAGRRNVYYQGVDGLIVTQRGYENLDAAKEIQPNEIGKLRLLLTTDRGEIFGASDYVLANKVVLSGRSNVTEVSETGEIMQKKFSSLQYMFDGKAVSSIEEEMYDWKRRGQYKKGVVGRDGWITPLEFFEGSQTETKG